MITFPQNNPLLRTVALYYAKKLGHTPLLDFFENRGTITDESQALLVCTQFQQLIDAAMLDNQVPDQLSEIKNIESLLFGLFNLVHQAVLALGFEEQWQQAADLARQQAK